MSLALITLYLSLPILIIGLIFSSIRIQGKNLRLLLAFSAAYLFAISVIHLLPECYEGSNYHQVGIFIIIGFFVQIIIDFFSSGIEHGHVHSHSDTCHKHLPLGMIVGLFLHSLLEGLPIYQSSGHLHDNHAMLNTQQSLIFGITLHNIPIAIAFVTLLLDHQTSKLKTILLLIGFAMMAPLGVLLSYTLHSFGINNYEGFLKLSFGVVIGIFLHISTAIMFETGENHKYNVVKILSMIAGVTLAAFIS
jgi:zinc and cadmium transporter